MEQSFKYTIVEVSQVDNFALVVYEKESFDPVIRRIAIPDEIAESDIEDFVKSQVGPCAPLEAWGGDSIERDVSYPETSNSFLIIHDEELNDIYQVELVRDKSYIVSKIYRDEKVFLFTQKCEKGEEIIVEEHPEYMTEQLARSPFCALIPSGSFTSYNDNHEPFVHEADLVNRVGYGVYFPGNYRFVANEDESVWICVSPIQRLIEDGYRVTIEHSSFKEGDKLPDGILAYGLADNRGSIVKVGGRIKEGFIAKDTCVVLRTSYVKAE